MRIRQCTPARYLWYLLRVGFYVVGGGFRRRLRWRFMGQEMSVQPCVVSPGLVSRYRNLFEIYILVSAQDSH